MLAQLSPLIRQRFRATLLEDYGRAARLVGELHSIRHRMEAEVRKSDNREFIRDEYLGDNPFGHFVVVEQAESWDSFLRWIELVGYLA